MLKPFRSAMPPVRLALLASLSLTAQAEEAQQLDAVTVRPKTSTTPALPLSAPAVVEGKRREQIEATTNLTDSSDALKYLPSLTVRKRYIGDFDHAITATRTSGTGLSARTLTYADGLLLSNLLGNANNYTPRWGMVAPEEIERVDFLYGPFSAAYSGNAIGGVASFVTRMPEKTEGHVSSQFFSQGFKLYGSDKSYQGGQLNAAVGSRAGALSFWVSGSHVDNTSQPIGFVNTAGTTSASGTYTPVSGAVADRSTAGADRWVLGTTSEIHTQQDNARIKLAYDLSPTLRADYSFGLWTNHADRLSSTYLRDAAGNPVWQGNVLINGQRYNIASTSFANSTQDAEHQMHAFGLKSSSGGKWDWSANFSLYDYAKDIQRSSVPDSTKSETVNAAGTAGRITDMKGTGWRNLDLAGVWRPQGRSGAHEASFGLHDDHYQLRTVVWNTPDWIAGSPGSVQGITRYSQFDGSTETRALWAQDVWKFAPDWSATGGLRYERWHAFNGALASAGSATQYLPERHEQFFSPKAGLRWQATQDWSLRASLARAYRMPTVAELYQGSVTAGSVVNNDPNLRPENARSTELTAEGEDIVGGVLRISLFHERVRDALYSQVNAIAGGTVTTIQNIDLIRSQGIELAWRGDNIAASRIDLAGSVTYADSRILKNDKNPASVGKKQIRVPDWRASLSATWHQNERLSWSGAARYSGRQFGNIDNSDVYEDTYFGNTRFFMLDAKAVYQLTAMLKASVGVDNLGNNKAWSFHPYSQRTYFVSLKADF
jgi:iron complex outermembrane recepter protein